MLGHQLPRAASRIAAQQNIPRTNNERLPCTAACHLGRRRRSNFLDNGLGKSRKALAPQWRNIGREGSVESGYLTVSTELEVPAAFTASVEGLRQGRRTDSLHP